MLHESLNSHIPVPVFFLDCKFNIVYYNREADRLFEIAAGKNKKKSFLKYFTVDSQKLFKNNLSKSNNAEILRDIELLINSNNKGLEIPVKLYIRRVKNSEDHGYSCAIVDLKQQKETESALKDARVDAEIALQTKSKFLANLSHEIRTPMNAIIGFTEVLSKNIKDENSLNFLQSIKSSGQTLLKLINNILDLAKLENGKIVIEESPESLQILFNELRHIFYQKITEKGLEFIIHLEKKLPQSVYIDKIRLQQILINLISNAEKFTHLGYIRISVLCKRHDRVGYINLSISVEDTGLGIETFQKDKIFEPFTQNDKQDASVFGGTGLGLAISKHLADLMNGKLSVDSAPGRGSKFTLFLEKIKVAEEMNDEHDFDFINEKSGLPEDNKILQYSEIAEKKIEKKDLISLIINSDTNNDTILDHISEKLIYVDDNRKKKLKLLNILEENIMPIWENISRNNIITEIEEFAKMVLDLAKAYQNIKLENWSDLLIKQVDEFDMEKFPATLAIFPRILEQLVVEIEE